MNRSPFLATPPSVKDACSQFGMLEGSQPCHAEIT